MSNFHQSALYLAINADSFFNQFFGVTLGPRFQGNFGRTKIFFVWGKFRLPFLSFLPRIASEVEG